MQNKENVLWKNILKSFFSNKFKLKSNKGDLANTFNIRLHYLKNIIFLYLKLNKDQLKKIISQENGNFIF